LVKLIVYCPPEAQEPILSALAQAGVGRIGAYDSWSIGFGVEERFRPLEGSHPYQGQTGSLTELTVRRLEFQVEDRRYLEVIDLVKAHHPYEVPPIEVLPLLYPTEPG